MFQRYFFVLIVLTTFASTYGSNAVVYHGDLYGYSLSIPMDWEPIPPDIIQQHASAVIQNQNVKNEIIYDAAFQPSSKENWFGYPCVMVQVIPYANYGIFRQINEDEFPQIIKSMTGMDIEKAIDSTLTSDARARVSDANIGQLQLDKNRRRYLLPFTMNVAGSGKGRGILAGYFGRECLVQIGFYASEAEWDQQLASGQSVLDSFRFDPAKDYSVAVAAANPSGGSIWSGVGEKALAGASTGLALVLIGYIKSHFKKPASSASKDAD